MVNFIYFYCITTGFGFKCTSFFRAPLESVFEGLLTDVIRQDILALASLENHTQVLNWCDQICDKIDHRDLNVQGCGHQEVRDDFE